MADEVTISVRAEDNFSGVLGNFGSIMTGIESVVNLASQAFGFAKDIIGDFVNSASESEQAVARLDGVLRATGGAVGLTSQELQEMANGLQDVTRFSDETILNGEAILLTFRNLSGEMFARTVPAMLDMAEIFGSVDSAAMQLGKALNDPLTGMGALSRAGITFSEEQKDMIKNFVELGDIASAQNIILSEVEAQVSGLAETMGQTFAGQVEIFNNRLDTVKETIGTAFLPILTDFINLLEDNIPILQDWANTLADAISTGDFTELTTRIQNAFASIDWVALGAEIEAGLIEAIEGVDWNAIGLEFNTAMQQEFDFTSGSGALSQAIGDAFTALVAGGFGYMDWDSLAVDFREGVLYVLHYGFDDLGRDLGLFDTLRSVFSFGFDDLIQLIKTKLGISSPSTVFSNIARYMVLGLIGGWTSTIGNFIEAIEDSISNIIDLFPDWLQDAIGLDAGGLGSAGGGTVPDNGGTGTGGSGQTVNNYFYGPVYIGSGSDLDNADYDCPSPNPLVGASGNQLVVTGY